MKHESRIIACGPEDEHAYDVISECPRTRNLDARCPTCHGHGQWNEEIDLVSFRSKRATCGHCYGSGWIETGDHLVEVPDIVMTPLGYPAWILREIPPNV